VLRPACAFFGRTRKETRWSGISGFLDDSKTIKEKTKEELFEELGIKPNQIKKLKSALFLNMKALLIIKFGLLILFWQKF